MFPKVILIGLTVKGIANICQNSQTCKCRKIKKKTGQEYTNSNFFFELFIHKSDYLGTVFISQKVG